MSHRMKVYGVQMALRVACIIGVFLIDNLTVRVLLILGAAVLPWLAVMLANRGADRSQRAGSAYQPPTRTELPTVAETRDVSPEAGDVVVDGEVRWVDALPLSPNGKIDRAALSAELGA